MGDIVFFHSAANDDNGYCETDEIQKNRKKNWNDEGTNVCALDDIQHLPFLPYPMMSCNKKFRPTQVTTMTNGKPQPNAKHNSNVLGTSVSLLTLNLLREKGLVDTTQTALQ